MNRMTDWVVLFISKSSGTFTNTITRNASCWVIYAKELNRHLSTGSRYFQCTYYKIFPVTIMLRACIHIDGHYDEEASVREIKAK